MAKKAKKKAKKAGKKGAKKGAAKGASLGPTLLKPGKGASVGEVAGRFVQMFNAQPGNDAAIWDALFHKKFTSIEGGMVWQGRKAVQAKGDEFHSRNVVNACTCEGPYVGSTGFGVRFNIDMTDKASGQRVQMSELAVYTVKNGKVVEEQFFYAGR